MIRAAIQLLRQERWQALLLLVACWLIFFSPLLFGQRVYFADDLRNIFYPLEHTYAEFQHRWELPLWSTEFGFGHPLLAWGQLGFFTPLHVLLRAFYFPPLIVLQISVAAYYGLGLAGMYIFLRRFTVPLAAATGSLIYVFSGFHAGHLSHVNFYTATMLLPWLLVCLDRFVRQPTLRSASLTSLVSAAILLSGQPQVVAYTALAASIIACGLFIAHRNLLRPFLPRLSKLVVLTATILLISLGLGSLAILPLYEFLPSTERSEALPDFELYEFSYPPAHAITLLLPYFFGGYGDYWGAKGFQELAGYVGIAPFLLAGSALGSWRTNRAMRGTAAVLLLISIVMTLGKYSPVYVWLVEHRLLTSFGVPGRFIFFADVAFALLAAFALHDTSMRRPSGRTAWVPLLVALLVTVLIILPFCLALSTSLPMRSRLVEIVTGWQPDWLLTFAGLLATTWLLIPTARAITTRRLLVVVVAVVTLLFFGWNHNPRTPYAVASQSSPFAPTLAAHQQATNIPARLLSTHLVSDTALKARAKTTDYISDRFSVHQPLPIEHDYARCILVPYRVSESIKGTVTISWRKDLLSTPLYSEEYSEHQLLSRDSLEICLPGSEYVGQTLILSFESLSRSPLQLYYLPHPDNQDGVYFVRVTDPSLAELRRSQKPAHLVLIPSRQTHIDTEVLLLSRHLNVIADASSARWIGALSIKNYREFIESFFANDGEQIDGDGQYALTKWRSIADLAGITHVIQSLVPGSHDYITEAGFPLAQQEKTALQEMRLYTNDAVFPKAFVVGQAEFVAGNDEARYLIKHTPFNPQEKAFINGPTPPAFLPNIPLPELQASTSLISYTSTRVDVDVTTNHDAFLILTDSTTPQWRTFIDNEPAPYFVADTAFKAAFVPQGKHTVSFRYYSPATHQALLVTLLSALTLAAMAVIGSPKLQARFRRRGSEAVSRDNSLKLS